MDALPVHQFTRTEKGWHAVYINLDENQKLRFMLSQGENLHTKFVVVFCVLFYISTLFRGLLPDYIREDDQRKHWEVSPEAGTIINQITEKLVESFYGHLSSIAFQNRRQRWICFIC